MDDDDYYHPDFLGTTVEALLEHDPMHSIVGFDCFLVLIVSTGELKFSGHGWCAGGTLCFFRQLWKQIPFRDIPKAVDWWFLKDHAPRRIKVRDPELYILLRHNFGHLWTTMRKQDVTEYFRRQPNYSKSLRELISSEDLAFYENLRTVLKTQVPNKTNDSASARGAGQRQRAAGLELDFVAPLAVVMPVRNRAGQRLRNALSSLAWQSVGRPAQVIVVSHGSQPDIDRELSELCDEEAATLIRIGDPSKAWNKPLALNTGIRATLPDIPFIMTMDADMILAPNFFEVVIGRLEQEPKAVVLCRSSDLPQHMSIPSSRQALKDAFDSLKATVRLRPRYGPGGIQAARRSFFFDIRGYDEDLLWWGAMDTDLVNRARLAGLKNEWIEDRTAMLHQWNPYKHAALTCREEIEQAKGAWRRNHTLVRSRSKRLVRNPDGWGRWDG